MKAPGALLPTKEIKRICDDPDELMRWTLKQLKAEERPHSKKIEWLPQLMFDALVNKKDLEGLKRLLAEHPEAAPYAMLMYAEFTFPQPGRKKRRPRREETLAGLDHNANLAVAAIIYYRIGMIWQQRLGKINRAEYPTRADIAAEYVGDVTPNQVQNYVDNPQRYRRR